MRIICLIEYGFGVPLLCELTKLGEVTLVRRGAPSKAQRVKLWVKLALGLVSKRVRARTLDVVAIGAFRAGAPVKWTRSANSPAFVTWLRSQKPDLIVSAGFGEILRPETIASAPVAVHFHPSLLPAYRGPMPSHWIIHNGETRSGATCHHLSERVNAGDILFQEGFDVPRHTTADEHEERAAGLCASMTDRLIAGIKAGSLPRCPQDEERSSYYGFADIWRRP